MNMYSRILIEEKGEVVAIFGEAKLVKTLPPSPKRYGGRAPKKYVLKGGSAEDHAEAKEWISLFLHEAVVKTTNES
jgi:hypothetical protein